MKEAISLTILLLQSEAADSLSKFYYPPVAAVSVSYPKEAIRDDRLIDGQLKGFGQLHPRSQGVETLGYFSSHISKFYMIFKIFLNNVIFLWFV